MHLIYPTCILLFLCGLPLVLINYKPRKKVSDEESAMQNQDRFQLGLCLIIMAIGLAFIATVITRLYN